MEDTMELNANCNLTISDYDETEPAEMTNRVLEPHMEGLVEWYGYGSIAGLNARATYYTNADDDEIAADTGDFGSIDWDTRLSHVDIITDDHVVVVTIHNPDHEA